MPLAMTDSSPSIRATVTGRSSAWDWASIIRYEANAAAGLGLTRGEPVWIASAD